MPPAAQSSDAAYDNTVETASNREHGYQGIADTYGQWMFRHLPAILGWSWERLNKTPARAHHRECAIGLLDLDYIRAHGDPHEQRGPSSMLLAQRTPSFLQP